MPASWRSSALDLVGLTLGVFVALVLRELYLGDWPPIWGVVWDTETKWLPFLTVITVLVFWVGGLYRRRELRAGVGQIVLSLVLVAAITLAFGLGTGYHFTTYGLTPTAVVTTAVFIGILRASYELLTRDVLRLAGARRRTVLVGEGEQLADLRRMLGADRSGIRYEFLGAIAPNGDTGDLAVLGGFDAVPRILREHDVHELIVDRRWLRRARAARARRGGASVRREGEDRSAHDRAASAAGGVHPG